MITDSEFVMIKGFDKTLARNTAHAQGIINAKNALLVNADKVVTAQRRRIAALEAALVDEQRKTKALASQLERFMAMHH